MDKNSGIRVILKAKQTKTKVSILPMEIALRHTDALEMFCRKLISLPTGLLADAICKPYAPCCQ